MPKSTQKIQHLWSLVCERAVVDSTTNNVSLTNVLEEIRVIPSPDMELGIERDIKNPIVIPLSFNLVSTIKKIVSSEYNGEFQVSILDPKNKVVNVNSHEIKIPAHNNRFRTIALIQGFAVTTAGEYKFVIKIKENGQKEFTKLEEILLDVKIALPATSKAKYP